MVTTDLVFSELFYTISTITTNSASMWTTGTTVPTVRGTAIIRTSVYHICSLKVLIIQCGFCPFDQLALVCISFSTATHNSDDVMGPAQV
jgi:hypothetical protein